MDEGEKHVVKKMLKEKQEKAVRFLAAPLIEGQMQYLEVRKAVEGVLGRPMDEGEKQILQQLLKEKNGGDGTRAPRCIN
jgi:hypothetical protein